ncbi:MAG TPA: hypothetical protein ENK59_05610 [Thioploca sp.]|nr:hypothetical protein [Thioploca sp.]
MGFFDIPSPFFSWFDTVILSTFLSPMLKLAVWGIIGSVISMGLYVLLSSQDKLSKLKIEISTTRKALNNYNGEFSGAWKLISKSLKLSGKQIGLTLVPAVLASLPVLFLLVWLGTDYNYILPEAGTVIEITISPTSETIQLNANKTEDGKWQLIWPTETEQLIDSKDNSIINFPLTKAIPILHKRQWWNSLFDNPNGYIPESSPLEQINIALPQNKYITIGPEWLHSAEVAFLLFVVICSLIIQFTFRIN